MILSGGCYWPRLTSCPYPSPLPALFRHALRQLSCGADKKCVEPFWELATDYDSCAGIAQLNRPGGDAHYFLLLFTSASQEVIFFSRLSSSARTSASGFASPWKEAAMASG